MWGVGFSEHVGGHWACVAVGFVVRVGMGGWMGCGTLL